MLSILQWWCRRSGQSVIRFNDVGNSKRGSMLLRVCSGPGLVFSVCDENQPECRADEPDQQSDKVAGCIWKDAHAKDPNETNSQPRQPESIH